MYNTTRDTLGFAIKATHSIIDGEEKLLYKDPKTDDGTKKSHKGRVVVLEDKEGNLVGIDGLTVEEQNSYDNDKLTEVYCNGNLTKDMTLKEIRKNVEKSINRVDLI